MKSILFALVFCVSAAWADQAADRAAIGNTVIAVGAWPARADIFTADFDGRAELARVLRGGIPVVCPEVWGELCSSPVGMGHGLPIAVTKIRFLTNDVALVDAVAGRPLLVVLRRKAEFGRLLRSAHWPLRI